MSGADPHLQALRTLIDERVRGLLYVLAQHPTDPARGRLRRG